MRIVMALQSLQPQAGMLVRFALAALAGLALAGCQLVPKARTQGPSGSAAQAGEVQPDEPRLNLPPGETRNRVAILVPLTGPNAAVGQSIANSANLALADTASEKIRITAYDTASGAVAAANRAISEGNGLFLGPLLAEDALAVAPVARRASVPVIAFSNDVSVAGDGVYLLGLDPSQAIDRVVAYARSRGALRFGALLPTTVYGERAGRAFADAVQRHGGQLVAVRTYARTADALRTAAGELGGQGPFDAVLVADGARLSASAVAPLRRGSPQVRILGTELWSSEANIGAQAALRGGWFAGPSNVHFNQLRTRYRTRYGANPYRLGSLGYDGVLLAVRSADAWRLGRRFPARSLRADDGFAGVDGAFRFARGGIAERALQVEEVTAGGTNVLDAAPAGFR
jgi:ABC-type branched-subunit amino acid transport system substrate-binding protein